LEIIIKIYNLQNIPFLIRNLPLSWKLNNFFYLKCFYIHYTHKKNYIHHCNTNKYTCVLNLKLCIYIIDIFRLLVTQLKQLVVGLRIVCKCWTWFSLMVIMYYYYIFIVLELIYFLLAAICIFYIFGFMAVVEFIFAKKILYFIV
jgi:hypothetical protein